MKTPLLLCLVLITGMLFSACTLGGNSDATKTTKDANKPPAAEEKRGDTSMTGKISGSEGAYFIQVSGKAPEQIESYAVELSEYVDQTVTVTGQYSGDTLFVGSVE